MISLGKILKESPLPEATNIQRIQEGLNELVKTTHLVGSQIQENLQSYIENFDDSKFSHKIGTVHEFLGSGVFGAVFRLTNGKTFKFTLDFREAPFLYVYCYKANTPGFVVVDKMYEDKFGNSKCFYIVRDPIKKIGDTAAVEKVILEYRKGGRNLTYPDPLRSGVSQALQAMYNMDDNWRGTHVNNLAIQKGKVVLYDGFSKKATPQASIEKF